MNLPLFETDCRVFCLIKNPMPSALNIATFANYLAFLDNFCPFFTIGVNILNGRWLDFES